MTECEYFDHLEIRVSCELAGMKQKELRGLWCDGFIPEDFSAVGERCRMTGSVWVAFGQERQESWQFVLYLGPVRPRDHIDWAAMLPHKDTTGWLAMDFDTRFMKMNPLDAYTDGRPAAP